MNESPFKGSVEARRRGLRVIWGGQLCTILLFFLLAYFARTREPNANHTLAWTLGAIGFVTFLASFLVKRKLLAQAAAERRLDLATTAYVAAFVLCEVSAILGFLAYFITGLSYALHSFIVAVGGMLLHFPTRNALDGIESNQASADFKTTL